MNKNAHFSYQFCQNSHKRASTQPIIFQERVLAKRFSNRITHIQKSGVMNNDHFVSFPNLKSYKQSHYIVTTLRNKGSPRLKWQFEANLYMSNR
ncbi:hypothetical protein FGO68_gene16186 [Halteria grandinella]|uniref:Uncharacterized protein n=1 Tax=Halteria grandinella TaxID=5974 RepID=A0A8J8SY61_HALGN|nr:hypothetical protein FGO68_gene16186 [Halteria grandinella]